MDPGGGGGGGGGGGWVREEDPLGDEIAHRSSGPGDRSPRDT